MCQLLYICSAIQSQNVSDARVVVKFCLNFVLFAVLHQSTHTFLYNFVHVLTLLVLFSFVLNKEVGLKDTDVRQCCMPATYKLGISSLCTAFCTKDFQYFKGYMIMIYFQFFFISIKASFPNEVICNYFASS